MRKNIIFALCAILVMVTLTACGNEGTSSAYTIEYRDNDDQQVTTSDSVSDENPANVDNSGHEPESYRSGNFQDYWEGEDYFDIEGFAMDNGCDCVLWADDNGQTDKASANRVILFYGDWEIYVNDGHTLYAQNPVTKTERIMTPSYDSNLVSICRENNIKIGAEACQYVNDLLEEFKSN